MSAKGLGCGGIVQGDCELPRPSNRRRPAPSHAARPARHTVDTVMTRARFTVRTISRERGDRDRQLGEDHTTLSVDDARPGRHRARDDLLRAEWSRAFKKLDRMRGAHRSRVYPRSEAILTQVGASPTACDEQSRPTT